MPRQTPEGDSAIVSYDMTLDNEPLPGCLGNALCARVQRLCNHDFRDEPWYVDNLFLIMCYVTSGPIIILEMLFMGYFGALGTFLKTLVPAMLGGGCIILATIPLCGTVSCIQRRGRRSSFITRLTIDSRKKYRVPRWIFCLYAPISVIIFGAMALPFHAAIWDVYTASLFPGIWCGIFYIVHLYACFRSLFSIYSQLLSSEGPRDYTQCEN